MPPFASNASKEDGKENAAYVIRERSMTWGVGFSLFAFTARVSSHAFNFIHRRKAFQIGHELHISGLTLATLGTVQFLL
jgi:hypothetical protein